MVGKKKWIAVTMVVLAGLLAAGFGCKAPAPTTPAPAPKPAPTTPAATPKPSPTAAPATGAAPKPIAGVKMPQFFRFQGGSSPGSSSDILTGLQERLLSKAFPEMSIRRLPGGTVEQLARLVLNEVDMVVLTNLSVVLEAWDGKLKGYEGKQATYMRQIYWQSIGDLSYPFLVLKNSPIKDVSELGNKKIGVGPTTSRSKDFFDMAFTAYGFSLDSIKKAGGMVYYGGVTDSLELLAAGDLDAFGYGVIHPFSNYEALNVQRGLRFLPYSDAAIKAVEEKSGGDAGAETLDTSKYSGLSGKIKTFTSLNVSMVSKDMPDDVVYNILSVLFASNDPYYETHPGFKGIDLAAYATHRSAAIPVHPGAAKYWADRGMKFEYTGPKKP